MEEIEDMKRKYRSFDRLNREIDELERLIEDTEPGSRSRIALNQAKHAMWKEARQIFSDIRKKQGDLVEKGHEVHDFRGMRGYGRRFGVSDLDEYVRYTLRAFQSYFSEGYLKGYRQALRDTGHLD